jgi:hypothetical protein
LAITAFGLRPVYKVVPMFKCTWCNRRRVSDEGPGIKDRSRWDALPGIYDDGWSKDRTAGVACRVVSAGRSEGDPNSDLRTPSALGLGLVVLTLSDSCERGLVLANDDDLGVDPIASEGGKRY